MNTDSGRRRAARGEDVQVDFNRPLAGRKILFDVLVHAVAPAELH